MTIFQYGAGPNGVMRTLGKFMLGSGATFGYVFAIPCAASAWQYVWEKDTANSYLTMNSLFMSIGSVIRTDGPHNDAWLRARGPPMMLPRQSAFRPVRQ